MLMANTTPKDHLLKAYLLESYDSLKNLQKKNVEGTSLRIYPIVLGANGVC